MKVLIADDLSSAAEQVFKDRGLEVDVKTGLSPEGLCDIIGDYDGLAVRSATKVTATVLAAASRLKVVGRAGIGVDNIDRDAATRKGVVVMNTPFGNAVTTAEHALALMMACARQIPTANASTHAGKWEKSRFMGVELSGRTLGVIGVGTIGSIVADRAQGLKMKVLAYDPFLSEDRAAALRITAVSLDELLARSDFITIHAPLTDATRNLIDAAAIVRMKPRVRLINCARGGIVDEAALLQGLVSGKLAGAALDVFATEPACQHPLFGREDVVCTPHLGASTEEAQENVALQVAEQIADYLLTGAVVNALNAPSVSAEEAPRLRPSLALSESLGLLAGQVGGVGLKAVEIVLEGAAALLPPAPLEQTLLAALLRPVSERVNQVNASISARERGIKVTTTQTVGAGAYQTLIRLTVHGAARFSVAGTLFGDRRVRIVEINGIAVEAALGPDMLYIVNDDKPGLIGALGMLLAEAGVNIANFHLGRDSAGGAALALLQLDSPLSADDVSRIRALALIRDAHAVRFPEGS